MAGATTVTLVGGLTADPETRSVGSSTVANFTIAVGERQFDRDSNEWVEKGTSFYRCAAWRELGEHVGTSLSKGDRVVAQGTMRQRSYETKEGEKRDVWEVEIDEIGPSLRYATAQVTRTTGNRNQAARQQQAAGRPQGQPRQQQPAAQQQPALGGWGAGSYDDGAPF